MRVDISQRMRVLDYLNSLSILEMVKTHLKREMGKI